jgi:hypothetical protein
VKGCLVPFAFAFQTNWDFVKKVPQEINNKKETGETGIAWCCTYYTEWSLSDQANGDREYHETTFQAPRLGFREGVKEASGAFELDMRVW